MMLLGSVATEAAQLAAQQMGDLCTGGQASGTGLRGAYYYAASRGDKPLLVRVDARINADTALSWPAPVAAAAPKLVRWCGWIRPIVSGPYRFRADAGALKVQIAKKAMTGPGANPDAFIDMKAGELYPIFMELPLTGAVPRFSLQWTPPFGVTYDVPQTVLFPPVATVEPGC